MTNLHVKQSPFVGYAGFGGGAGGLYYKSSSSKTYVDDVFNSYVKKGTNANMTIDNGIDLAGEGGMVWYKPRDAGLDWNVIDTVRGVQNYIQQNDTAAQITASDKLSAFNDNGFTWGNGVGSNEIAWWTFRKQKGFCDIVTYEGNGSTGQNVSHNLGSIPGMIIVKNIDASGSWFVYHTDKGEDYAGLLNTNSAFYSTSSWDNTAPTDTQFSVKHNDTNNSGDTYIAYLFAGGESSASTARSVDFDGSSDYLSIADDSEFALGSDDFTFEAWIKIDALNTNGAGWLTDWNLGQLGWYFGTATANSVANRFIFGWSDTGSNINTIDSGYTVKADGQFHHYAITRNGTNLYFFVDGTWVYTHIGVTESFYNPSGDIAVGQNPDVGGSAWLVNGKISNLRLIKGTCLYTTSFRPPTEPLTNVTNTILLCCNDSAVTGSTVTPSTITAVGSPTASTHSPFADPAAFKFGEDADKSIIKMGTYIGNGANNGAEIEGPIVDLGWEPQWVLVKATGVGEKWTLFNSMTPHGTGLLNYLNVNDTDTEGTSNFLEVNSDGFQITLGHDQINANNEPYMYMAIRRPDGYVGKPPSANTSVFAIDTGNSTSDIPTFDSAFPVDFALYKAPSSSTSWNSPARLTGTHFVYPNSTDAQSSNSNYTWDSNLGWSKNGDSSSYQSWMWKRHSGFDVVTYDGNMVSGHQIAHSLNAVPEMIWVKRRTGADDWNVYHKDLNGGTNPEQYYMVLNDYAAETSATNRWNDTAPTSTHFTVGNETKVNYDPSTYIALLFASANDADGNPISKVGNFTPDSSGSFTVTLGFTPRFMVLKPRTFADNNWGWWVYDSVRGFAASSTNKLVLESSAAQITGSTNGTTSTGINFTGWGDQSSNNWIYYAHK